MTPRKEVLDSPSAMRRGVNAALWAAPLLISFFVYRQGLFCELQQDDYAWLGLHLEVNSLADWPRVLFEPRAQGTVRPISERLFFILYSILFGLWAFPYRLTVFAVQALNLILLNAIGRRLTGSAAAGCLAALAWTANPALAVPMSWTSAFNQVLCAFCVFGAFYFLLRFAQSGRAGDWRAQWLLYLLGFGALELNVVYPVLASAYAALCAPRLWRRTLLLWLPALGYVALHRTFVSPSLEGPYALYFGVSMIDVFIEHWVRTLGPSQIGLLFPVGPWFGPLGSLVLTTALAGFALGQARQGRRQGLFLLLWFVIAIAPYLPLRDHRLNYYPFLASAGLSLLAGWGLYAGWARSKRAGMFASVTALLYLVSALPIGRAQMFYYYARGQRVKPLVEGVVEVRRRHPEKTIFISEVDEPLFWGAIYDQPFRLWGVKGVFLVPGAFDEGTARYRSERPRFERVIEPARAKANQLIVLRLEGVELKDVTKDWLGQEP